jgi:hypothetical protein
MESLSPPRRRQQHHPIFYFGRPIRNTRKCSNQERFSPYLRMLEHKPIDQLLLRYYGLSRTIYMVQSHRQRLLQRVGGPAIREGTKIHQAIAAIRTGQHGPTTSLHSLYQIIICQGGNPRTRPHDRIQPSTQQRQDQHGLYDHDRGRRPTIH